MRSPGGRTREDLLREFRSARKSPDLAVLEGLHAIKHAHRFGAEFSSVVTTNRSALEALIRSIDPSLSEILPSVTEIPGELFARLGPIQIPTGVIGITRRPSARLEEVLAGPDLLVLLEEPRDLSNVGASVRVAAAAGAGGLLTTGFKDPWSPEALRTSAGLHFALPVVRVEGFLETDRPIIAIDPAGGEVLGSAPLSERAILAFGTERGGLSEELHARAAKSIRIPMRAGVSSLNLATSVAAVLYSQADR